MDCPRCDRPLDRYALGGREAVGCGSCGYIGVPVEHRGELREVESWDDAISRFEEVGGVEAATVETTETDSTPSVVVENVDDEPDPTVVRIETGESGLPADADGSDGTDGSDDSDDAVACDVCGDRFETRAQLNGHLAVHSGEEDGT